MKSKKNKRLLKTAKRKRKTTKYHQKRRHTRKAIRGGNFFKTKPPKRLYLPSNDENELYIGDIVEFKDFNTYVRNAQHDEPPSMSSNSHKGQFLVTATYQYWSSDDKFVDVIYATPTRKERLIKKVKGVPMINLLEERNRIPQNERYMLPEWKTLECKSFLRKISKFRGYQNVPSHELNLISKYPQYYHIPKTTTIHPARNSKGIIKGWSPGME